MYAGLQLVTPPPFDPISIADAKAHSRFFAGVEDSLIGGYIAAATKRCEQICKRAFVTQQWRLALEYFPGRSYVGLRSPVDYPHYYKWAFIHIPKPPLVSIDIFTYTGSDGTVYSMTEGYDNTVGNYLVDTDPEPGKIKLPFAGIWPTTILVPGANVFITYTCGYPSFTGTATIDANGIATAATGTFDPRLVGTWMNFGGCSYDVASFTDSTHIQLVSQAVNQLTLPVTVPVSFRGSAVPVGIQMAILYLATHYFTNRIPIATGRGLVSVEVQNTMDDLLASHRVSIVGMPTEAGG